jgi:hypothetical protein
LTTFDVERGEWTAPVPLEPRIDLDLSQGATATSVDGAIVLHVDAMLDTHRGNVAVVVRDLARGEATVVPAPVDVEVREYSSLRTASASDGHRLVSVGIHVSAIEGTSGAGRRIGFAVEPAGVSVDVAPPPDTPITGSSIFGPELPATLTWVGNGYVLLGGLGSTWARQGDLTTTGGIALASDASVGRWQSLPKAPIDVHREGQVAVFTGSELIVWGGAVVGGPSLNVADTPVMDGARYKPGS